LAKKLKKSLDEATVYRALEALASSGIIRRVDLGHSHAHYEFEKSHHHHIVCTDCGVVEDIEVISVEKELEKMTGSSKQFKSIYSHNLEFFGSCKSCSN
jgi:Fe2+ or Zn2+ uptake regulation protein